MSEIKSLLRWAGAKGWLTPLIESDSRDSRRYLEPFLGSGAIFINLESPRAQMASDENRELILTFRSVRDEPEAVIDELAKLSNDESSYYRVRGLDRNPNFSDLSTAIRAARFLYLNHTCFNGLFRVNGRGYFNVPYGKRAVTLDSIISRVPSISEILRQKLNEAGQENLLTQDYRGLIDNAQEGDFVYLDPPYFKALGSSNFVAYTAGKFHDHHHFSLLDWMSASREMGIRALMSNSMSDELEKNAIDLGLRVEKVSKPRKISAKVTGRGQVEEVLIANY